MRGAVRSDALEVRFEPNHYQTQPENFDAVEPDLNRNFEEMPSSLGPIPETLEERSGTTDHPAVTPLERSPVPELSTPPPLHSTPAAETALSEPPTSRVL